MRYLLFFSVLTSFLFLQSCASTVNSKMLSSAYPAINKDQQVFFLQHSEEVPENSILVGNLKVGDSGFAVNCSYETAVEKASMEARNCGANIILVTEVKEPSIKNTCYRMKALMYRNMDEDVLIRTEKRIEEKNQSRLPENADYAVIYFYRPTNSFGALVGLKIKTEGEMVICKLKDGDKFAYKTKEFGEHTFLAKTESEDVVEINVEKGKEYFVHCGIQMGIVVGQPELDVVDNYIGIEQYEKMK
ncbi:MAG: DUF2846 domain-containing protein [Chitinophagales bacterium]|nr:DUF2846 domain-containing protein [Chitinophagales bacterium]